MRFPIQTAVVVLCALSMSACTVLDHTVAKAQDDKHAASVNVRFNEMQAPPAAARVQDNNGIWVNKRATTSSVEDALPPMFRQPFQLNQASRAPLVDVLNRVTTQTGMRVTVSPDARAAVDAMTLPAGFSHGDDLRSFLDQQTSIAGLAWKWRGGAIDIFKFDTMVFRIVAQPGVTDFGTTMSSRAGSASGSSAAAGGAGGGSANAQISGGQELKMSTKMDFWGSLKNDLKNLLSRDGKDATYTVSESTRTVTVTATPPTLSQVETFIKALNAERSKQVWLDIRAYTVGRTNGRDFGVAWQAAYSKLTKDLGISASNPSADTTSLGVIKATLGPSSTSVFANSSVMLNALSTMGTATLAAENSGMVPSGEVMATSKMREVVYLARVSTTAVQNAGTQTSLEPGTTSEGFSLSVIPTVRNGDTIEIKGQIDISSIDKIATDGVGNQIIRTPQRTASQVPISAFVKSGETYVWGRREVLTSYADSGLTGTSLLDLPLGGQRSSKEDRQTIVVTITPFIINQD